MRTFFCSPFANRSNDQYTSYPDEGVGPEVSVETILLDKEGEMGPLSIKLRSSANPSPRSAISESEQSNCQFRDVSNSFPLLSSQWAKTESLFATSTYMPQNNSRSNRIEQRRTNQLPQQIHARARLTSDIAEAWLRMETSSLSTATATSETTKSTLSSKDKIHPNKAPQLLLHKDGPQRSCPRPEMVRHRSKEHSRTRTSSRPRSVQSDLSVTSITGTATSCVSTKSAPITTKLSKTAPVRDPTELKDCLTAQGRAVAKSYKKPTPTLHKRKMSTSATPSNPNSKWRSAVDPKSGRTYYYHLETRETQWRKPMELATKEERAVMEEKERRQREFFAQMEANILKSMSQGVLPGGASPTQKLRRGPSGSATTNSPSVPPRSPCNLRSALKQLPRPPMIRTISSMDEDVLKDLVKRVPSTRDLTGKKAKSKGSNAKRRENIPLVALDETQTRDYESSVDLLNSLPSDGLATVVEADMDSSSVFHESSSNGFLSWEETRALQKLAQVTHEMAIMPDDSSPMRDITETTCEEEEDEEDDNHATLEIKWNGAPQESSEYSLKGSPSPVSPPTVLQLPKFESKESPTSTKPELKRRNTCGTLYVGSTMSAPDKDATIRVVCGVFRAHIMQSEAEEIKAPLGPEVEEYRIFNDQESQQKARRGSIGVQRRRSLEHKSSLSIRPQPPELEEICFFYRDVFRRSQMESDCIIMSLIYVERLIKSTEGALRPRTSNWRSLLFSCMILASKVWDDLSMWNADFSQACPPGVQFTLQRINELEVAVLSALKFIVKVPASEYAKYYFVLRSMLIKSGLGGGDMLSNTPLDVEGARRLQQVTAQFQATAATKARMIEERSLRSKSMGDAEKRRMREGAMRALDTKNKVSLEHMVKM